MNPNHRRTKTMSRKRSITSIDAEIRKTEEELSKVQARCDALSARLLELQNLKHEYEQNQIMEAFRKSGKSLQELMTFLDV